MHHTNQGSANIFAKGKIVILTRKEGYIVPIIKNIEKAVYLTKSAIPCNVSIFEK